MKILILIISIAFFTSCNNEQPIKTINIETKKRDTIPSAAIIIDSNLWINDFKDFRDAVYKRDIGKVKTYFDFPINKEGEGIWYFSDKDYYDENRDTTRKFTEKEFVKYYDKIFDKDFIKALLKIKTEELLVKKETQTPKLSNGKDKHYIMSASFDLSTLRLQLNSSDLYRQKNYEPIMTEFSIILVFDIVNYNKIKYRLFTFAG